jgi:hypothetical protein
MSCPTAKKPSGKPRADSSAVSRAELDILRQKAVELSIQNPQKAAVILSTWLNGAAARSVPRKKTG